MGARLGQHFLKNPAIAKALVAACHIKEGESVLEIGPGTGALTRELLATGGNVIAIEKDEPLAKKLSEVFLSEITSGKLKIVTGDVRDFDPRSYKLEARSYVLAANIPYYITGEILRQFLTSRAQPRTVALLIQKEVAERIISKKESLLSLSVKAYGEPRIVLKVSRGNFSPPPSVDSAILLIEHISRKNFPDSDFEKAFFEILHLGFAQKRKMLLNNLASKFGKVRTEMAFVSSLIPKKARAEDVPLEKWLELTRYLIDN